MIFIFNPITCFLGLLFSLWSFHNFATSEYAPRNSFDNYGLGELVGYYFLPSLPLIFFIFATIKTWKIFVEKDNNINENSSSQNMKETLNFKGKKIELNPKKEVSFKDQKLSIKTSDIHYRKKNESNDHSHDSIKEELKKVEELYKQKLINASERKKMREKILGINE